MKIFNAIALFAVVTLCGCDKAEEAPTGVVTSAATNVTAYSATSGGQITSGGELSVLNRGVCWSTEKNPTLQDSHTTTGNGFGSFSSDIDNLHAGETYYTRAYIITAKDTLYGAQVEFTTPDYVQLNSNTAYGTVTDVDGNVYKTVTIGAQTWMAENLRTTHYRNGDALANIKEPKFWMGYGDNSSAYCYFNYDDSKAAIYGAYYNWYAAADSRNIAPEGWHVATKEDWEKLKEYSSSTFGAQYVNQLREATTAHWRENKGSRFNETGFTALGADRAFTATDLYWSRGNYANFWTSSGSADLPLYASLGDALSVHPDQGNKGFSIRCVKD